MIQTTTRFFTKTATLTAALASLLCLTAGCGGGEKEATPVVSVQTTPAERATISQVISAEAVVYPIEQATISPKITSTIKKFHVQRGTPVKAGQLLAELENADLSGFAIASKGDYKQAQASYETTIKAGLPQQIQKAELDAAAAKVAFEAQQKVYDSRKELFQQGAIPRRDLDSAEVAFLQARSQNEQAQKQLADLKRVGEEQARIAAEGTKESAQGRMENAVAQLSYSRIVSPIDGVVTDRPPYEGDLATANQPILTVMNLSILRAKSHIPQSEAAALKKGDSADVKVAGVDDPIKGKVSLVSPALDPGSTTIEVWVDVAKPDPALKPGVTVEVAMTAKTVKDAIVVPASAVYKNDQGADYVLVAGSDQKAHVKTVQIGIRNADHAQILSGISVGDPVISSGGYALPDNTQVKVEAPGEKEKGEADDKAGDKADKPGASAKAADKNKDKDKD